MADLYSILPGIQPDQQDIIEAELLAKQILQAEYPDLDLREGTGIRDLVLRPAAFLLAMCKKGFDYYFSQNTLNKIDNTSPTEVVDDLLSNLFLTRNTGSYSVVNSRLYFARQKSVSLNTSISFSTDGVLLFFPTVSTTYPSTALQFDAFQNEWFLDVDLIAGEKGINYNISSGSLLYFSNFDPYFLHGEINYLSQASTSPETNLEFIARAQSSISTRNLINDPSITSKLTSSFNYLNRIKNIGAGEPEMYRDQARVLGGPEKTFNGSAMSLTDSNTKMLVTLDSHGFVAGQLLDIVESGSSPSKLILRSCTVTDVINVNTFKVNVVFSVSPRAFLYPVITTVNGNIFVHQGGMVDIHCGEELVSDLVKFTLDAEGKCFIEGPVYEYTRSSVSDGAPDTADFIAAYEHTYPGHVIDSSISISQSGDGTITIHMVNHPMSIGRMIEINEWPVSEFSSYHTVVAILDENTFKVGSGLPIYSVSGGLDTSIAYVYPAYDVGFSSRQKILLDFGVPYAGLTATFRLDKFDFVDSIQSYLELSSNRVLCADYMARGFDVYILDINVGVYDTVLPASGYAASIVDPFLKALSPGQDFILSDLVANLTLSGGITKLKTPLTVNYRYYTKDMFPVKTGLVVDAITPENNTSIFVMGVITTSLEVL